MARCGRCKGRGYIRAIHGLDLEDCPACSKGVKVQKASLGSKTVSVPVDGAACRVCGEPAVHSHHVISQNRLDRYVLEGERQRAKADRRNTVPLCYVCHDRVEAASLELAPHELHPGFSSFVSEYDLEAALPRYLTERTVRS